MFSDYAGFNGVHIIGGGLAGCEAAWQCVRRDIPVMLHEMRPVICTDVHKTAGLAELVCSNSFRSDDADSSAIGVLHAELRLGSSLIMSCGDAHRLPAGSALAVDREGFSRSVTECLSEHPLVTIIREEVLSLPSPDWSSVIISTGPLTSASLSDDMRRVTGDEGLAFFDAIAPIVYADTIDMGIAWRQSRYDKGSDYINCPLDRSGYEDFIASLLAGDVGDFHDWEKKTPYFEGCLPIEVMAARGRETLRFGPMKPVGLTNPHRPDEKPYAVVQLRQDNADGSLYNMVGFQTKLTYGAQGRIFRMIPGLSGAEFARLGGIHRNTFLNSPTLLDSELRLRGAHHIRFAGQMTGVEGYIESASCGFVAGVLAAGDFLGKGWRVPPRTTAHGALIAYITGGHRSSVVEGGTGGSFQPMNINYGLFPPIADVCDEHGKSIGGKAGKSARRQALGSRALSDFRDWLGRLH